ncbi:MAG: ATP-binding protein [Betaproteobacteria bacterium]
MSDSPRPLAWIPRGLQGRVWLAGALVIVGMAVFQVYDVFRRFDIVLDDARRELRSTTRALAEQTAQAMRATDLVLRDAAELPDGQRPGADASWEAFWRTRIRDIPQIRMLAAIREDGITRASTRGGRPGPTPPVVRAEVASLRADPSHALRTAGTFALSEGGIPTMALAQPLRRADGSLDTVVVAYLDLDYFARFYGGQPLTPGCRISLLGSDGATLVAHETGARGGGPEAPDRAMLRSLLATVAGPAGSGESNDGARIFAVHRVPGFPFAVGMSSARAAVLAPWYVQATHSAARTTLLCASVALLIGLVLRELRRRGRTEERLRIQTASLDELIESAPEAIAMLDLDGRVARVNREFTTMFGYGHEESRGQSLQTLIVPEDLVGESQRIVQAVNEGRRVGTETRRKRRDGSSLHVSALSSPVLLPTGQIASFAIYRDITERRSAEAERGMLEARLRQAEKLEAVGRVAGGIAHDFNSILSAILGFGNLALADGSTEETRKRYISSVIAAATRGRGLVDQILTYSRSTRGRRALVGVRALVVEALDLVQASLPGSIALEVRLIAGDETIIADPTHVHQLVMNLCSNAVRAMGAGGTLAVVLDELRISTSTALSHGTLPAGHHVVLTVSDTGCGMEPAVVSRIFEPFFTTGQEGIGTGFGLALVHGIISDLGGAIDVRTVGGKGSTFALYMPVSDAAALDRAQGDPTLQRGQGERILLVDGDKAAMLLGEEMLAALNYEPAGFTRSADALTELCNDPSRFDAAIVDHMMPEITGTQLVRHLRAARNDLPIVLTTRDAGPFLMQEAIAAGVDEILGKPLDLRELGAALRRVTIR